MAKFRFPGKALKLNTRKRVRFRGSHAANTPEELYTRRIRRGLDLFTQIFGDSDEDDEEFEGFTSILPEPRDVKGKKKIVGSPRKKKLPPLRLEEACSALEEEGLVTRRKVSAVEMAIKEVQEKPDVSKNVPVVTRRRVGVGDTTSGKEMTGSSKDVSTRQRISAVEIATKEVPEGSENKDLPIVTRRRVSVIETKEGAERNKDPPVVTRRRGHSLEGIVKDTEQPENVPLNEEKLSGGQELPQSVGSENIENVITPEKSTKESDLTLRESKVVVMAPGQMVRKTARRVSRPSTVKTALAKKLLARAKAKRTVNSLPVVGEKSPKRFVLPSMSVRSSRIIKPNKRLFADITDMCTASSSLETVGEGTELENIPNKRLVKLTRKGRSSHTQFLSLPRSRAQSTDSLSSSEGGGGRDRMRRTISLYTESITGPSKAQVGRPPKRLLRRMEPPQPEIEAEVPDSPQRCDPKESKVMEKIGKLLRSPWDNRLKQSGKGGRGEEEGLPSAFSSSAMSATALSRNILRKARLNLNKTTLQKIRNPVSLQRLIPASDQGVEGKCAVCDTEDGNFRKFGVVLCDKCSSFISNSSDGSREVYECKDKVECQVQEDVEGRCNACWLGRILHVCTMPNLLHDRLRKRLPNILKEQIPTSLARCMSGNTAPSASEKDADLTTHTKRLPLDPGGGGAFGSVMDLPGGWKRKTGPEVIVISPSGEKFKSMQKLEEFLKKQGITTDARVLFGNSSPAVVRSNEAKSRSSQATNNSSRGKVVMTTLPGGWVRRIKWRSAGDRFDTYVYSPDGRTFRSRRELSAYFQLIGKVDDIHKYFPVVTGHSDASIPSSSDTTGSSSTERLSSSEPCSEISSDDKSPEASECEAEPSRSRGRKLSRTGKEKMKVPRIKPNKVKNHKEGHHRSKSVSSLKNVESVQKAEVQMEVATAADTKAVEKKYKKPKIIVRSRSLSLGRKKADASLTDTTESESENKNSGKGFAKAFSKRLKNKPKVAVHLASPSDTGTNTSNESGDKTTPALEPKGETEVSEVQKPDTAEDRAHVFIKPEAVSLEKPSEQRKIVLKIQKKNIENVDRRHRYRNKEEKRRKTSCFEVAGSLSEEQVAQSGAESVQNMTAEKVLAQLSSTSKSSEEGKEKVFSNSSDDLDREMIDGESDIPVGPDISDDSKFSSPMVSESEPTQETIEVPEAKPKSKPKKPSNYQTSHFGGGWSRKIKWNEKGEGKIALLHSPDGQTFRSRIELLAYFKKAGKSKGNLDFYFPPVLKREDYGEVLEKKKSPSEVTMALGTSTSSQSSEVSDFTDSEVPKTSEESCISGEEGTKRRISRIVKCYRKGSSLKSISESGVEDSQITSGKSNQLEETWKHAKSGRKELFVTIPDSKQSVKSESEEIDGTLPEAVGPRVKHVCRSQAQVLGIPRAVFPSPGKEDDKPPMKVMVPSSKSDKKRKIVTVTTTASGKVLRKTQWCNKCPGCTTPNCRKCVNCLDMKKYGGPGTKKKPCVMRKCHNPRLSIKSAINQEGTTKIPVHISTSTTLPTSKEVRKVPPAVIKTQEEKTMTTETSSDLVLKSSFQQEKAVFVPRQMTRSQPDQKDRGDIAAGKQFVPGTLVNIDYWQGYDADEMMLTGYPVITASSQNPQILCFRCGSLGKEQLLYCAWCCEGVHPYCLEDGEGPESEVEEAFWICRRCAVCYVCGAPGADSLLRCSDCRNYYHMECLGPSAHSTCQPPPDRPWEAESMALLAESWPKQSAIFDAGGGEAKSVLGDIVMHTDLDAVKDMDEDAEDEDLEPDIFFLPVGEEVEEKESSMFEREDSLSGDELEDSFCLEDSIIEVFRDIDLYKPEPSPTANIRGEEVATMRDDEYLYLGYKKIYEYPTNRIEMSYFRLLQIIHNELFATHGYPTWREMLRNGLVADRSSGSMSGSDTETASEGMSESEESDLDWDDIFEIRRHEAAEELKERDDKRREEERRQREIEREKARIERQKEMEREAKEKELSQGKEKDSFTPKMKILGSDKVASPQELAKKHLFKKKRKCGRPPGSLNKPKYGDEDFVVFDDYDEECQDEQGITPRRKRLKQPRSWEEFDELFARSGLVSDAPAGGSKEVRIRKRKVVYSDNGIIGMRHEKFKLRAKRQKLGLVSSKKFKNLKDVSRSKILKFKDKIMRRPGRPPKIKPEKRELYDVEEKIQPKKKKQNVRDNFEYSGKKSGSKPNGINREIPGETKGEGNEAVNRNSSSGNKCSEDGSDENSTKDQIESGLLETPTNQSGKKGRPEEENSDKENLPGVDAASKLKEAETVISQKTHINGLEEAGTSTCTQSAEGVEEETKQGKNEAKCLDLSVANLPKLPEKRARRSVGRASELASQRKAMMDF